MCLDRSLNAFVCVRPPGHHAGLVGCTSKCSSTGFCLLNNVALAAVHARLRCGVSRVAVVDFDVHFGNGTAEVFGGGRDKDLFFASVHLRYPRELEERTLRAIAERRAGAGAPPRRKDEPAAGVDFVPAGLGGLALSKNFVSVGVLPGAYAGACGAELAEMMGRAEARGAQISAEAAAGLLAGPPGFRQAFELFVLPALRDFDPELVIISAGFDGFHTDPLGGDLGLGVQDFAWVTEAIGAVAAGGSCKGRLVSVLEGGYDTAAATMGLAECVDAHVAALRRM